MAIDINLGQFSLCEIQARSAHPTYIPSYSSELERVGLQSWPMLIKRLVFAAKLKSKLMNSQWACRTGIFQRQICACTAYCRGKVQVIICRERRDQSPRVMLGLLVRQDSLASLWSGLECLSPAYEKDRSRRFAAWGIEGRLVNNS